jgi:hypothetical protein
MNIFFKRNQTGQAMNKLLLLVVFGLFLNSCDCMQKASGVVLDSETKEPLDKVSLGKYAKENAANSFSRRSFTDNKGQFDYSSTGGGFGSCDFDLFFSKEGYESMKVKIQQTSDNDTVFLKRIR